MSAAVQRPTTTVQRAQQRQPVQLSCALMGRPFTSGLVPCRRQQLAVLARAETESQEASTSQPVRRPVAAGCLLQSKAGDRRPPGPRHGASRLGACAVGSWPRSTGPDTPRINERRRRRASLRRSPSGSGGSASGSCRPRRGRTCPLASTCSSRQWSPSRRCVFADARHALPCYSYGSCGAGAGG